MSLIVRDKNFYKTVLAIAVPIALQNMVTSAVGMLDTIMLGQLGEVAMSASSLANQVGWRGRDSDQPVLGPWRC